MAYGYTLDYVTTSRRSVVRGMKFPMGDSEGGYFALSMDNQTLIDGLVQGIKTQKGERVMYPDFGTTIRRRLFDQFTDSVLREIQIEIEALVSRYFPRLRIGPVRIGQLAQGNESENNSILIQTTVYFRNQPGVEEDLDLIMN